MHWRGAVSDHFSNKSVLQVCAPVFLACCCSVAAGVAPILGGALSHWFASKELSLVFHWASEDQIVSLVAMRLRHWDFFFAIAFLLGLVAVWRLDKVVEDGEVASARWSMSSCSRRGAACATCRPSPGCG